jgi:hypothetical protein
LNAAQRSGWSDTQLAEAFAQLRLTVFSASTLVLAPNLSRFLVRAQPEKCRVPQPPVAGEFHESDPRDELRLRPLHLAHLVSRDTGTPPRFLVVGQIGEWAPVDLKVLPSFQNRSVGKA